MDIVTVLNHKFPDSEWVVYDNDISTLTWLSDSPKPTKKELEDLWPVVQAEIEAERQARENRKQSVIEKLGALGLTPDEVADVFGLEVQA
jgi:hypothetical protein